MSDQNDPKVSIPSPMPPKTGDTPAVPPSTKPKRRRWPLYLGALVIALLLLGGVGFVTASALEENDSFCTSCHTVPETTYFNRSYMALDNPTEVVTDLATAHYHDMQVKGKEPFKCIDCHRGDSSLGQRIATLALAGRDSVTWVLQREDPTIEKVHIKEAWLPNNACVTCHTDVLLKLDGINNHFHNFLPQAAAALAKGGKLTGTNQQLIENGLQTINVDLLCTSCHIPHKTIANGAKNAFMDIDMRNEACITCHLTAKKGPQDVKELQNR